MENLETPFLTFSNAKDDPNYLGDDEELNRGSSSNLV